MKVIIDILTPKQCMLFSKLSERLIKGGHQVFKTTREYREVQQLMRLKGVDAKVVGKHGGKNLMDKLKASAQRMIGLSSVFEEIRPDLAISFSSPEMARVSYGLKTPHVCISDSPHAEAVARLTIPLSEKLLTPKMIHKRAWTRYGISPNKIVQYNALDPWIWLKDLKPDRKILEKLMLDESKPVLTFRTEESFAAYLLGKTQRETSIIPTIEKLLEKRKELQIVAVPRYDNQIRTLQEVFKDRIVTCKSTIDGPSLLYHTSIFVGGGGTMSAEAALLGVVTFSCYPGRSFLLEKYLIRKKLVKRETDSDTLSKLILRTLDNLDSERNDRLMRAKALVNDFEDPIEIITKEVEEFA